MSRAQENYLNKRKVKEAAAMLAQQAPLMQPLMQQPLYPHHPPPPPQQVYVLPSGQQVVPAVDLASAGYTPQQAPAAGGDLDEDPGERAKNVLPIHGSSSTFNINPLLYNNIMEADYFKALYQLKTYHEVVDEIYPSVTHVAPWQTGTTRNPSTAFCLLLKFFLMRLTVKQMKGLLHTDDCPYVRAIGFLYLRYSCPPAALWEWFEPFLEDEEEFVPSTDASLTMTMGQYLKQLLTDMKYFGTTLPRIPVLSERKFQVLLLLLEERQRRRRANMHDLERGKFCKGAKVMAIYKDEVNEPAWYEAVIESRDTQDGLPAALNKFWVKFTEYGNTESVDLGDMKLMDGHGGGSDARREGRGRGSQERGDREDRGESRDRNRRRGDRDRDRDRDRYRDRDGNRDRDRDRERDRDGRDRDEGGVADQDYLARVLQKQRESSVAVGKNYASRPESYKSSLSLKMPSYTARKKSPTRSAETSRGDRRRSRSRSRDRDRDRDRDRGRSGGRGDRERDRDRARDRESNRGAAGASSLTKTETSREGMERLKKLRETYGDASSSK